MTREIIKSDRPPYGEPSFYPYVVPAYRGGGDSPIPIFAEVLADGRTLRVTFSDTLTAGDSSGFTWSEGYIDSGSYSGVYLDLVVGPIIDVDSVGTLSYDEGPGTVAGSSPVSSFGPVDITNSSTKTGTWTLASSSSLGTGWQGISKIPGTSDIALVESGGDTLSRYTWTGSAWSQVGSSLSLGALNLPAVCALDATTVVVADGSFGSVGATGIRAYTWNGSQYVYVTGSEATLGGSANVKFDITAMSTTRIVLWNGASKYFVEMTWNGANFSSVGQYAGGANALGAVAALSSTDFVGIHADDSVLQRFSVTPIATVGTGLDLGSSTTTDMSVARFGGNAVACAYGSGLGMYRYASGTFALVGTKLNTLGIPDTTHMIQWDDNTVVEVQKDAAVRRFTWS